MDLHLNKVERDRVKAYFSWPKEFRDMLQKLEQFQLYMNGSSSSAERSFSKTTTKAKNASVTRKRSKPRTWNSWNEEHKDANGIGLGISRREHLYETFAQLRKQDVSIGVGVFEQLKKQYGVTRVAIQTQYQRWTELQRG